MRALLALVRMRRFLSASLGYGRDTSHPASPRTRAAMKTKRRTLALYREDLDCVLVRQLAAQDRVLELHAEAGAAADAAFCRQRAAEHRVAAFQGIASHQIFRGAHRSDRAFLVKLAVLPRAQDQLFPVRLYLVVRPAV